MIYHRLRLLTQPLAVVLALAGAALHAEDYSITTFAGVGSVAGGADGSPGTFNNPLGVAVDSTHTVYVADTMNNTIRKITSAGVVSTFAGTMGTAGSTDATGTAARFDFPVGVALDSAGNLYVADAKNLTIRKITSAGVVTTFAGSPSQFGFTDGTGAAARFFLPYGVAVDSAGNVYVGDGGNHLVRKITSGGVVSTLAGSGLQSGSANGTGSAARFNTPWGVAVDSAGNVYVADSGNHTIRKVTSAGVVTTVAGTAGVSGSTDGPVSIARFNQPRGIAVDASGNLYVADYGSSTLRFISSAGIVSTLAGSAGVVGSADSVGSSARFFDPAGVAVTGTTAYVADSTNNLIRRGVPASSAALPTISIHPLDQEVSMGQSVPFRVVASGTSLTYQWLKNSSEIAGATQATYTIAAAQLTDVGAYSVRVRGAGGSVDSTKGNLSVVAAGTGAIVITARPLNQQVNVGEAVNFTVAAAGSGLTYQWFKNGTAITGATGATYTIASAQTSDAATYMVRLTAGSATETLSAKLAVGANSGPGFSISTQPVSQRVAAGQTATFFVAISGSASVTYQWYKNDVAVSGATSATYTIASVQASDVGNYRVRVTSSGGSIDSEVVSLALAGTDPDPAPTTYSRLANLSVMTNLSGAGDSFQFGYAVGGSGTTGSKPILIRAVGPSLATLGVGGVLPDPTMDLYASGTKTGSNDNWGGSATLSTAFTAVAAFPFASATSLDAAVLANISAGTNNVVVGANGTGSGLVLAELYDTTPVDNMTATSPRLINVSVLKHIGDLLTAGFVIDGNTTKRVLIRAVGPTLGAAPYNVGGVVADPQLALYSGGTVIGSNDNWGGGAELTAAMTQVGAFSLGATSRDAALLTTLQTGAYTVQVTGVGRTTGVALVEVYEVP